jgi:hypothetical protein
MKWMAPLETSRKEMVAPPGETHSIDIPPGTIVAVIVETASGSTFSFRAVGGETMEITAAKADGPMQVTIQCHREVGRHLSPVKNESASGTEGSHE